MKQKNMWLFVILYGVLSSLTATDLVNQSFDGTTFPPNDWFVSNTSGMNWDRGTVYTNSGLGTARYNTNSSQAANSWLFTPLVQLVGGKTYIVDFYQQAGGYAEMPENLKITYGNAQTISTQTNVIQDYPGLYNADWINRVSTFTPTASGTYSIGFQCYSVKDNDILRVDDVRIYEQPSAPIFSVAPALYDYGNIAVNTTKSQNFTITNAGVGTLEITAGNITVTGINAIDFEIGSITYPISLVNGQNTTIPVNFAPKTAGVKSASLHVVDNATKAVHDIPLSGEGHTGLSVYPYIQNFNDTSFPPEGWLAPLGSGTADSYYNEHSGQIRWYSSSNYMPASAESGGYEPGYGGSGHSAVFQTVWFYNTVICELQSTYFDLSNQSNMELSFYLMNKPDYITNSDKVQIFVQDGTSTPVQLGEDISGISNLWDWTKFTRSLAAYCGSGHNDVRIIVKAFSDHGTSNIALDDFKVDLGPVNPIFSITPTIKNYGFIPTNTPKLQNFVITNIGGGSLTIASGGVTITGANTNDFSLGSISYPINLTNGQSVTIPVSLSPLTAGSKSASLRIVDNTTKAVQNISLSGTGYAPLTTGGLPNAVGFSESFETYNSSDPYYNKWYITFTPSGTAHSGAAGIKSSTSTQQIAVTPRIIVNQNDAVDYWITRSASATAIDFILGYSTDFDQASASFTPLTTLALTDIGTTYEHKVKSLNSLAGQSIYLGLLCTSTGSTIIDDFKFSNMVLSVNADIKSKTTALYQNYPNPFNNRTQITFNLENKSTVLLSVYNSSGQKVKELLNSELNAGQHNIYFNADNLNTGVYFVKLQAGNFSTQNKIVLTK